MTVFTPADLQGSETQAVVPPSRSPRARVAWTVGGLVVAIAIVPALALSFVGSAAYQTLASRQRVFTSPITGVTIDVSSGDITVVRRTGVDTMVTTSGVHGLTYPTDDEHVVGQTLVIRSSCGSMLFNDRCSRNYVLQLQSGVAVTADSAQGDVKVAGTDHSVSVHSDQGDVTITGASGTVQASSGQGGVTISGSAATSVSANSGQGDVVVELTSSPNRVTASSGQGDVTVALPKGPNSYRVQASSGQGNVSNTVDNNPASGRVVTATSGQGDVTVRYHSG
jgi:Putative adhesin